MGGLFSYCFLLPDAIRQRQRVIPLSAWVSSLAVAFSPCVPATEALADSSTCAASWRT